MDPEDVELEDEQSNGQHQKSEQPASKSVLRRIVHRAMCFMWRVLMCGTEIFKRPVIRLGKVILRLDYLPFPDLRHSPPV